MPCNFINSARAGFVELFALVEVDGDTTGGVTAGGGVVGPDSGIGVADEVDNVPQGCFARRVCVK